MTWTAPSSGGPPTSYMVTPYIGSTAQATTTVTGTPPATTANVTQPDPGHGVHVHACRRPTPTAQGRRPATPARSPRPAPPRRTLRTGVAAATAGGQAQVNWTDPTDDGGSSITGYKITPYLGTTAQTPVSVGADKTTATVTGLTNGASYTFTVTAVNGVGLDRSRRIPRP